jgi:hypothetical protein
MTGVTGGSPRGCRAERAEDSARVAGATRSDREPERVAAFGDRATWTATPVPSRAARLRGTGSSSLEARPAAGWPSRSQAAPRVVMQRVRDRHEVGLAEEHERRAVVGGQLDRADGMLDDSFAIGRPSEHAGAEAAQRALVVGQHGLRLPSLADSSLLRAGRSGVGRRNCSSSLGMSHACRSTSESARLRSSTCASPRVSRRATITSPREPASSLRSSCIGTSRNPNP